MSETILQAWRAAWPDALAAWSRYTRLGEPLLCAHTIEAAAEGLQGSFAMIRLADQRVVIDLEAVCRHGLEGYATEILAHEIGHHVLAPASVTDHLRLLARIRAALPTLERHAPMIANLYTDLFINDRLQRQAGLRIADIYAVLAARDEASASGQVWQLYMGICEELWQRKGQLGAGADAARATDAWLGARLVRVYANDWLDGAGRFATLLLPYLVDDSRVPPELLDTLEACAGAEPAGALGVDREELQGALHPVHDPLISGLDEAGQADERPPLPDVPQGQCREPFAYGEMLRAAGVKLTDVEIAVRYYRERALPHLVPFPARRAPEVEEPQLEGHEPWNIGDPLDEIDWLHSLALAPVPIPGVTTFKRTYGREAGSTEQVLPMDLDMYVDSSGSMPNPRVATSWLALAGAVIALSALRAGASVRVTLWSGKHEVLETDGFTRDEQCILAVLTGYFGGGTAFPIHRLRDTWCGPGLRPRPGRRPTHLLMISDEGIDTLFAADERRNSGWDVAAAALRAAGAGGTMALNLSSWFIERGKAGGVPAYDTLQRAEREQGWQISAIQKMEDLLEFARVFSRRHYADAGRRA
ncbi:hypothetical protein IP92_05273 [Pseudoduganella flava]|uniref:VWA domain-containing protein n=1 Tax=Pseudoduganella flava TaxID=871742 RepID=A0A562PEV8_9BURK|nr:VWA domain-containing protein [Pseudoduganella flava]QGZ38868.1 VWA domain-containing protein [Pseudoduganella flava]TWI42939.1 hypothetical protein IP92_05273 [Pseudoduganella flava]